MIKYKFFLIIIFAVITIKGFSQKKFLFDASKAETAGNADWIIDADHWNLDYIPYAVLGGNEANAQRFPNPSQNNINANTAETYWKGALSSWGVELVKKGYHVETLPYNGQITYLDAGNPQDLSNYNVFVVCEPNIKFTSSEKSAILHFVKNGGGLFMVADHNNSDRNGDGYDSPHIWNDLIFNNNVENNPFGFKFDYEFFTEATQNIVNPPGNPLTYGEYGKVTQVEFYGGTSMTLYPGSNTSVKGVVFRNGVSTNGTHQVLCAYSEYGEGKVVALGDSSPADDGSGDIHDNLYDGWLEDAFGNHRKLIMNGSIWLASNFLSTGNDFAMNNTVRIFKKENNYYFITDDNNLNNEKLHLIVYDILGNVIVNKHVNFNNNPYFTIYNKGFYIYRLTSKNGEIFTGKLFR